MRLGITRSSQVKKSSEFRVWCRVEGQRCLAQRTGFGMSKEHHAPFYALVGILRIYSVDANPLSYSCAAGRLEMMLVPFLEIRSTVCCLQWYLSSRSIHDILEPIHVASLLLFHFGVLPIEFRDEVHPGAIQVDCFNFCRGWHCFYCSSV